MMTENEWKLEMKRLKDEISRLKENNDKWKEEFNLIIQYRASGQKFEKDGMLPEAITSYQKSIFIGRNSQRLNLSNFVFDIERVIILYSKTKQKNLLVNFLNEIIELYPSYRDIEKWKERLQKLVANKNT